MPDIRNSGLCLAVEMLPFIFQIHYTKHCKDLLNSNAVEQVTIMLRLLLEIRSPAL